MEAWRVWTTCPQSMYESWTPWVEQLHRRIVFIPRIHHRCTEHCTVCVSWVIPLFMLWVSDIHRPRGVDQSRHCNNTAGWQVFSLLISWCMCSQTLPLSAVYKNILLANNNVLWLRGQNRWPEALCFRVCRQFVRCA